jgi:ribonuclease PH
MNIHREIPRNIKFTPNINPYAQGSVLAEFGNTKVHITAMISDSVPPWMKGQGRGWVTAEYSMLPASSSDRIKRERHGPGGRSQEIQRLIGRSLRACVDLTLLGEHSIQVDCDVLVADGGTRTASISGAYVALSLAFDQLLKKGDLKKSPLIETIAALSVGIDKDNQVIADLNYEEDSQCHTDMNFVMTKDGRFIEVQGTAEGNPFSRDEFNAMTECAWRALQVVFKKQEEVLK